MGLSASSIFSALGDSGINYRSEVIEGQPFALRRYQADLNGPGEYTGSNYEERRRTTLASRGQRGILPPISADDSLKDHIKDNQWLPKIVTGSSGDPDSLKAAMVNRRMTGWMGVQVHVGPPMRIAYRNLMLKTLKHPLSQCRTPCRAARILTGGYQQGAIVAYV